jgi:hypothetical protein
MFVIFCQLFYLYEADSHSLALEEIYAQLRCKFEFYVGIS